MRAEFAYAGARALARVGDLPRAADWLALDACRGAAHYIETARAGRLADWVQGLDGGAGAHALEGEMRARWLRHVALVARWLPGRWRAAANAFARLVELPLAPEPPDETAAAWRAEWRRLAPAGEDAAALEAAAWLLPRLAGATEGRDAAAESARRALRRMLRRQGGTAGAVFAYLALLALDLERLRGGLVARAALPPDAGAGVPDPRRHPAPSAAAPAVIGTSQS